MTTYEANTLDVCNNFSTLVVVAESKELATKCFNAIVENPSNSLCSWQVPSENMWAGQKRQTANFELKQKIYGKK